MRVGGRPGLRSILSAGEPADMKALCIALVSALGLALGHSDQGKRPPAGNEDKEVCGCQQLRNSFGEGPTQKA